MRLVIDLQGAQALGSRHRGIGRYSRALAHGIIRNRGPHEVILALNGAFTDTIDAIRSEFSELNPDQIRVWAPLGNVHFADASNDARRLASEAYREHFLSSLSPDVVHVSSHFEGFGDDSVLSIGGLTSSIPTTVTLYDLIPLIYHERYFENPRFEQWYRNRLGHLLRADRLFAISESSRKEAIDYLQFENDRVIAVGTAADPQFKPSRLLAREISEIQRQVGLTRPFVLYTGGIDPRKNIEALIRAFAALPSSIRGTHQLAIVCSIQEQDRRRLQSLGNDCGLRATDLILTGFVPEEQLLALYSSCKLFVFPSWHEGFGLPALEAMCCGAPVIASDCSSLPEVVGLPEALFDPLEERAMSSAIERGLTDEQHRRRLLANAKKRIAQFSWDQTATKTIGGMEQLIREKASMISPSAAARPKMAFVSPVPPARSGIADYSQELLPYLSRYYDIDAVVKSDNVQVECPFIRGALKVVPEEQFREHHVEYDRILYQFGNSDHHGHMFDLLKTTGGVAVLHDFFLSGIVAHREWHTPGGGDAWWSELYRSHGYPALQYRRHANPESDAVWKYPCSGTVVDTASHIIVHSENSLRLAREWYGEEALGKFSIIPHLRVPERQARDKGSARLELGLNPTDFLVCSFGLLGPTKLNHRLIEAWFDAGYGAKADCKLVFVGMNDEGEYGLALLDAIKQRSAQNVSITGWADRELYRTYLQAADVAVQLRTSSRGETSGACLDCLNNGLSLIVNANGALADLPSDLVTILPDEFKTSQLVRALKELRAAPERRAEIGDRAVHFIRESHAPEVCARRYHEVIEQTYRRTRTEVDFVANVSSLALGPDSISCLAERWERQIQQRRKRLFVDVSQLSRFDARSGIQRVVRSLLNEFSKKDTNVRIEPVFYCQTVGRYRYARTFMSRFLKVHVGGLEDDVAEIGFGDDLFCLDLNPADVHQSAAYLRELRHTGVRVAFMVYDLLPIRHPDCFVEGAEEGHRRWLNVVLEADMAICISRAVADDLRAFVRDTAPESRVEILTFPLGADFRHYPDDRGTRGMGGADLGDSPTFLTVGTLEPRKDHALVLDAFELLWAEGIEVQLCIVGKQGWMVEGLIDRIRRITAVEPRLKWLENADDESLAQLYRSATCLIAASRDEGYGLPIVEAAHYHLPVLARDIAVFREVGGPWADYFPSSVTAKALAAHVIQWLGRAKSGEVPRGDPPRVITWKESAEVLLRIFSSERLPLENSEQQLAA